MPPGAASASTSAAASAASTGTKRPRLDLNSVMQEFVASPLQIGRVQKFLSLFFFKNDVALNRVGDEDLIAAFGVMGVPLPNRKQLAGPILLSCYNEQKAATEAVIKRSGLIGFSTDGWRSARMQSGLPLINVNILLQDGGSKFDRAIPVAGVTKDSRWIFELHSKLVDERGGEDSVDTYHAGDIDRMAPHDHDRHVVDIVLGSQMFMESHATGLHVLP